MQARAMRAKVPSMPRMPDSRNFARTLAATGLIAGPVLHFAGALLDPAWADDSAEYLREVAADEGLYAAAGVLFTVGSLLFVAGALGVARLLRGRRVTLGQIGASLIAIGLIGLTAAMAFNGFDIALADFGDRDAAAALSDELEDSVLLNVYWVSFFFVGIVLGSVLLAIALFRGRIVPIWSPILILAAVVVGFVGGEERVLSALTFLVLAAGFLPLAAKMWSIGDEAWAEWAPLEAERDRQERAEVTGAASSPATVGAGRLP
jgi:Domain of unknown function (DUF4386)